MARRVTSPVMVGRAGEMQQLLESLAGAGSGEPTLLIIEGEAGVGKSRLVTEFVARARDCGASIASGACVELAAGPLPYGPLMQIIRDLIRAAGPSDSMTRIGPEIAPLRWLVPDLDSYAGEGAGAAGSELPAARGPGPPAQGGGGDLRFDQARLFDSLLGLLRSSGAPGPTVVVLEDIHWADTATLDVLRFLVRAFRGEHVLLVATCRTDGPLPASVRHAIVELARAPRVQRISLERLGPDEVREMVGQIRGSDGGAGWDEDIVRRSQGNPLFAEELLASRAPGGSGDMPRSLRELLLDRLALLSGPAQAVLRGLAVIGRASDEGLLAAVCELEPSPTLAALREATLQQLIDRPGGGDPATYWFRHVLVGEAIRSDLLAGELRRLHVAAAEAMAARTSELGVPAAIAAAELAHHWRAGGRAVEALRAAVGAGELARGVWSYAEEARQYANALELWTAVAEPEAVAGIERLELLERLARALHDAGEFERAVSAGRAAIEAARPLDDSRRIGALTQRLGTYLSSADRDQDALEAHLAAAQLLGDDPALLARTLASVGATRMLLGRYRESAEACEQAIRLGSESGSAAVVAAARGFLGVDRVYLGHVSEGLGELDAAIEAARANESTETLLEAYHNIGCMLELVDRLEDSLAAASAGIALADKVGLDRRSGAGLRAVSGRALYRLGRWTEAESAFQEGLALNPGGEHRLNLLRGYAQLLVGFGRVGQARQFLEEAAVDIRLDALPEYAQACAEAELVDDRLDAARGALEPALAALARTDDRLRGAALSVLGIRIEADRARLAAASRLSMEVGRARALGAEHRRRALAIAAATADDPAGRRTSRIRVAAADAEWSRLEGRPDAERWRLLRDRVEEIGARPEIAYASYRLAEAILGSRGSRHEAEAALAEAAEAATSCGAQPLLHRLEDLARRGRLDMSATPRPRTPQSKATAPGIELTRREREVAELLAAGRTNRQIAEGLFITEKTAATHVSNILGKLGATNRYDAGDLARRLGLVADDVDTRGDEEVRSTVATSPARAGSERVVATILFTDIVGSTELASRLGDSAWRQLLQRHHAIVRRELARFHGRELDTAGDGFFAIFDSPASGVMAASALGLPLRALGLEIRAGLHTGECEVGDGKVVGIAVSIGARIAALAAPGEVLVSGTLRDLIAGSGLRFSDRGEHQLKGIPRAIRLFAVAP